MKAFKNWRQKDCDRKRTGSIISHDSFLERYAFVQRKNEGHHQSTNKNRNDVDDDGNHTGNKSGLTSQNQSTKRSKVPIMSNKVSPINEDGIVEPIVPQSRYQRFKR